MADTLLAIYIPKFTFSPDGEFSTAPNPRSLTSTSSSETCFVCVKLADEPALRQLLQTLPSDQYYFFKFNYPQGRSIYAVFKPTCDLENLSRNDFFLNHELEACFLYEQNKKNLSSLESSLEDSYISYYLIYQNKIIKYGGRMLISEGNFLEVENSNHSGNQGSEETFLPAQSDHDNIELGPDPSGNGNLDHFKDLKLEERSPSDESGSRETEATREPQTHTEPMEA